MLRVTIHAGSLKAASVYNRLAWLDIGYEELGPIAHYKTVLFQKGVGATLPVTIYDYPRWSASLWDLTARAIALGLREIPECLTEEVPPLVWEKKKHAFVTRVSALIEHAPMGGAERRTTLATACISQVGRSRCTYIAGFEEHGMRKQETNPFAFKTDFLRPAELVLHACLIRLTGKPEMPPRPTLQLPLTIAHDGQRYVPIHALAEHAQIGFLRWLSWNDCRPLAHNDAKQGIALESLYMQFLAEAV